MTAFADMDIIIRWYFYFCITNNTLRADLEILIQESKQEQSTLSMYQLRYIADFHL